MSTVVYLQDATDFANVAIGVFLATGRRRPFLPTAARCCRLLVGQHGRRELAFPFADLVDVLVHRPLGHQAVHAHGLGLADAVAAVFGLPIVLRVEIQVVENHLWVVDGRCKVTMLVDGRKQTSEKYHRGTCMVGRRITHHIRSDQVDAEPSRLGGQQEHRNGRPLRTELVDQFLPLDDRGRAIQPQEGHPEVVEEDFQQVQEACPLDDGQRDRGGEGSSSGRSSNDSR